MLRSMTGFGGARGQVEGVQYDVEIRSVNHRYLKPYVKLPENWATIEGEIEKVLRERIRRGSVAVTVRMKVRDDQAAWGVNGQALQRCLDQLTQLQVRANPTLRIDLGMLLQLPGVCEPPPLQELCRKTYGGLMELVAQALDALMTMREQEGRAVEKDLVENCDRVEKELLLVAERAPGVLQDYHERLSARVAELTNTAKIDIDQDTLAREVALFAERSDVAEEISRLGEHVRQFRDALGEPEAVGRKLDFIAQEMLREANTIASKSSDARIGKAVVEIKTAIDRIKEQVQNVE